MSSGLSLLEQFKPFLRYDSNEGYFADSAAEMTDAPANALLNSTRERIATPGSGEHDLSLKFLAAAGSKYLNGSNVAEDDRLGIEGQDYLGQYRAIRAKDEKYRNVVYGRVIEADGVTWLQYWFWFFNNDLRALGIGLGLHEGDWEGIELRMRGEEPDLAVYAQHGYAEAREWTRVKKHGERPVVYVAQGSHASYFDDGAPFTHWHLTEHFIDRADGEETPASDVTLEEIPDPAPGWALWPGRWGDTEKPQTGPDVYLELSSTSPTGPGSKDHWSDPACLLRAAERVGRAPGAVRAPPRLAPPPPPEPKLEAREEGGRLRIGYTAAPAKDEQRPTHLLVTVNSPDDPFPPTTFRLELEDEQGTVEIPLDVDPAHSYELRASTMAPDGALSRPVPAEVAPQAG